MSELTPQPFPLPGLASFEERGQRQIAPRLHPRQGTVGFIESVPEFPVRRLCGSVLDLAAESERLLDLVADPGRFDAGLEALPAALPVERPNLLQVKAHERVAVAEGMVEEGQRLVPCQGGEPQGELRQVDGDGIPVDAVEAVACHESAGLDGLVRCVVVGRKLGRGVVVVPGFHQDVGKLAAGLDQEGTGAHGGVADREVEDLLRARYGGGCLPAQASQNRLQGVPHDRTGKRTWRVVGTGTAAFLAGLEDQVAAPREVGRGVAVDHRVKRGVEFFERPSALHGLRVLPGQLPVGPLLQPANPFAGGLGEQFLQVHCHGGTVLLRRPDRRRKALCACEFETHHGLVDGADLLDVQGAVGEAFAVQHEQLLQRPEDGAVGDARRLDAQVVLADADRPPLEEGVAVRVEQDAVAGRQSQARRVGAVVDHSKERQQPCPGAVALIHRVGVQCGIGPQPFVEAAQGVVAFEGPVRRVRQKEAAFLRVQQEHQPEDHGKQAAVDVVAVRPEMLVEKFSAGGVVGRLDAAQELVQGVQHLVRELLADLVLVLPAVGEQRGEPLVPGQSQQPALVQQLPERGADGPAGHEQHVGDTKVHPARTLSVRRGDEAERMAVEQQAGGDSLRAEQALHPAVGRGFEPTDASVREDLVEIQAAVDRLHQQLPGRADALRLALADGEVGAQGLAVVGQVEIEFVRQRSAIAAGKAPG